LFSSFLHSFSIFLEIFQPSHLKKKIFESIHFHFCFWEIFEPINFHLFFWRFLNSFIFIFFLEIVEPIHFHLFFGDF
jgi:hypothetical protein